MRTLPYFSCRDCFPLMSVCCTVKLKEGKKYLTFADSKCRDYFCTSYWWMRFALISISVGVSVPKKNNIDKEFDNQLIWEERSIHKLRKGKSSQMDTAPHLGKQSKWYDLGRRLQPASHIALSVPSSIFLQSGLEHQCTGHGNGIPAAILFSNSQAPLLWDWSNSAAHLGW